MKRSVRILAAVLLAVTLLAGCAQTSKEQTVTCGDLSMTLPGSYVDLSSQDYAADLDLLYGFENEAVLGIREDRAALEAHYPGITALEYAQMYVDAAGLSCPVQEQEGLITFTYSAAVQNMEFTYLSGIFVSDSSFWVIQFYCPAGEFEENQADFLHCLQSVRV